MKAEQRSAFITPLSYITGLRATKQGKCNRPVWLDCHVPYRVVECQYTITIV